MNVLLREHVVSQTLHPMLFDRALVAADNESTGGARSDQGATAKEATLIIDVVIVTLRHCRRWGYSVLRVGKAWTTQKP